MTEEILIINTEDGVIKKEPKLEPFPIYNDNLPLLHQRIPEYTGSLPNKTINDLAGRLTATLKKFNGIGLSANQCGINVRMFVIGTDQFQMVCINPEIVNHSPETVEEYEGCLSFPGLKLKIPRYSWIEVKFLDSTGNEQQMTIGGLTARCFCHELNHLDGVVFTDHFKDKPVALRLAKEKQKKMLKKSSRKFS